MSIQEEDDQGAVRNDEDEVSEADLEMAREIANFIAARAFRFDDHECRAWALTDFGVWATLAGAEPELRMSGGRRPPDIPARPRPG